MPLVIAGRSGENVGRTEIQLWEKVVASPANKNTVWKEQSRWLLLSILSFILIFENILVSRIHDHRMWLIPDTENSDFTLWPAVVY